MAVKGKGAPSGEQLVKQEIITQADLDDARRHEEETGTPWYRQLLQSQKLGFGVLNDVLHYEFHTKAARDTHMSLGETLLESKAITKKQLREALSVQKRNGRLLGTILLDNGAVSLETIDRASASQYGLDYVNAPDMPSEQVALDFVAESMAKQNEIIPASLEGDRLTVLISGPRSPSRVKRVGVMLGVRVAALMTSVDDMAAEIDARYSGKLRGIQGKAKKSAPREKVEEIVEKTVPEITRSEDPMPAHEETERVEAPQDDLVESSRFDEILREAEGAPVVKLVATIIEGAVNSGATDIHLDPQEPEMRVRYRIDGVLHDVMSISHDIEHAIVSRLKILSDIDITETRRPQDGHISLEIGGNNYDIRVATMPTFVGERVVLRLLAQSSVLSGIKDLGLEPDDEKRLLRMIEQPYGMVLVTGPTGSGKTTTLYSCLNQKDVMSDSIVTLEDPVEYQLSGINQVQIDNDIDMTFANVLRASLRQDIDVLLVGEIRDPDTARIAIRAAMTGHLVFSTLHTNDAPEAITTLRNMGIPSYLISSALTSVVAQRLVRSICADCKKSFTPAKALLQSVGLPVSTRKLYRGAGCELCYQTGTRGRTGIFEVLEITPELRRMIAADDSTDKMMKAAKLKTMAQRCRNKVKAGIVTPEEFLRVIRT